MSYICGFNHVLRTRGQFDQFVWLNQYQLLALPLQARFQ